MAVSLLTTSRGGPNHVVGGFARRPQKKLPGDNCRWKCEKSGWQFKCPGFVTEDRKDGGPVVRNACDHSARCEPNNTAAAASHVRRVVIDRGVRWTGNPLRLVSDAVGDLGNDVISTLPNRQSLKRSAVNAKYMERGRAYEDPEGGQEPDFRSLADSVFPNALIHRPDGESFIIQYICTGGRGM